MKDSLLLTKSCIPCQGGQPPLEMDIVHKFLQELQNHWQVNDNGHLHKTYKFKDFKQAMSFANKIARLADKEGHHPDLFISWGVCSVEIWTHKINGLTESDFILAAKIEQIAIK